MMFSKFACAGLLASAVVAQGTSSISSDSGMRRLLQDPTGTPGTQAPTPPGTTEPPPSSTAAPAGTTAPAATPAPAGGNNGNFQGNFVNSGNSNTNNTSVDNAGATQNSYNGVVGSAINSPSNNTIGSNNNSNNTIGSNNVYINYVNEVTTQVISQYYNSSSTTYNYNEIQQIVQQIVNNPGTQAVLPGTDVTISAQGSSGAISQVVATTDSGSSTTVGGSTTATSSSMASTDSSIFTSGNQTCSNYGAACVFDPEVIAELDVLSLMVQLADCRSYASS